MKPILRILLLSLCCCLIAALAACSSSEDSGHVELHALETGGAFTTNVKDSKKVLKCEMTFQVAGEAASASHGGSDDTYILRDAVNMVLMNLTEDEVTKNLNIADIKLKLVAAANEALATDTVRDVKFTTFIVA